MKVEAEVLIPAVEYGDWNVELSILFLEEKLLLCDCVMPVLGYGSDGVGTGAGRAGGGMLLEPIALRIWNLLKFNKHNNLRH